MLKQQLLDRASRKHNVLEKKQQRLSESRPITAVQHIDNINLIHNYALEREKLVYVRSRGAPNAEPGRNRVLSCRQQSEREMEQALQEQRREFELKKRQALQDQVSDLFFKATI